MEKYALGNVSSIQQLVQIAHRSDGPVMLSDEKEEYLVVMTPLMFEQLLFDSSVLVDAAWVEEL